MQPVAPFRPASLLDAPAFETLKPASTGGTSFSDLLDQTAPANPPNTQVNGPRAHANPPGFQPIDDSQAPERKHPRAHVNPPSSSLGGGQTTVGGNPPSTPIDQQHHHHKHHHNHHRAQSGDP